MKVLYSHIKELVPGLTAGPKEVGEVLTMTGFMMDSFEEVTFQGEIDYLLGLEVRQNRADCTAVWGVAKEVAAYYGLIAVIPQLNINNLKSGDLKIKITAKDDVKRIKAVRIKGVKNQKSPAWLEEFLGFYDINSVNLLVDLSNYVMIMTGYTSHLLDLEKMQGDLNWSLNKKKVEITSLDGTQVVLEGGELVISDDKQILALAGIVGCQAAGISMTTQELILEMALYDRYLIKQNSRRLAIVTEASNRLSRDLDPLSLENACAYLTDLIVMMAGGEVVAETDYENKVKSSEAIVLKPNLISSFAGVTIENEQSMEILKSLRFQVEIESDKWLVTPPSDRLDINEPEDLIEEVIRMYRYDKIAHDRVPALMAVKDITNPLYWAKDRLRQYLVARGFDEILSQPLVSTELNELTNYIGWEQILTQNSVNEDFPALRLSLASGLFKQYQVFTKKNVAPIKIFEIGKVFGRIDNKYLEAENLAWLISVSDGSKALNQLRLEVETVLGQLGLCEVEYEKMSKSPRLANSNSCFVIKFEGQDLGVIYKTNLVEADAVYLAEINLEILIKLLSEPKVSAIYELNHKLVVLDANVEVVNADLEQRLAEIKTELGWECLWSLQVIDSYQLEETCRYTVRVTYRGLTDQEAKAVHQRIFQL